MDALGRFAKHSRSWSRTQLLTLLSPINRWLHAACLILNCFISGNKSKAPTLNIIFHNYFSYTNDMILPILPVQRNPLSYQIDPFLAGRSRLQQHQTTSQMLFPISCQQAQTRIRLFYTQKPTEASISSLILLFPLPVHQMVN